MVHVVDVAFNRRLQRLGFLMAQHQNHHFFRIQQRTHAYRQRVFRHLVYVAVKEAGVRYASIMG